MSGVVRLPGTSSPAVGTSSELQKALECPVCFELPSETPIYTCQVGHIVCKNCLPKLKACGLCRAPFIGTRSFTAEALLTTMQVECRHTGCSKVVKASEHAVHLKTCPFRPVPCFETRTMSCNGTLVDLHEFEKHLICTHKSLGVDEPAAGHEFTELSNDIKTDERWPLFYFRYDNNLFLRHLLIDKGTLYWWVTLVGMEQEARKYRISLCIFRKSDKKVKMQWDHPIHSNQYQFKEIREMGHLAGVYKDVLTSYCRETANFSFAFNTRYAIHKVDFRSPADKLTFSSLNIRI